MTRILTAILQASPRTGNFKTTKFKMASLRRQIRIPYRMPFEEIDFFQKPVSENITYADIAKDVIPCLVFEWKEQLSKYTHLYEFKEIVY